MTSCLEADHCIFFTNVFSVAHWKSWVLISGKKCLSPFALTSLSDSGYEPQAQAGWNLYGFECEGGWVKRKGDRKDVFSIHEQLRGVFPVSQTHLEN